MTYKPTSNTFPRNRSSFLCDSYVPLNRPQAIALITLSVLFVYRGVVRNATKNLWLNSGMFKAKKIEAFHEVTFRNTSVCRCSVQRISMEMKLVFFFVLVSIFGCYTSVHAQVTYSRFLARSSARMLK